MRGMTFSSQSRSQFLSGSWLSRGMFAALVAVAALTSFAVPTASFAQEKEEEPKQEQPQADAQDGLDPVSQQASQLEAELGKLKDATPEAAELMIKLVDLYHNNNRAFGLIRIGQQFVSRHASREEHAEVMLKLIDGLQAASRNDDCIAVIRQFLLRYPENEECPRLEVVLARTVEQTADRMAAGAAWQQVWERQPESQLGRDAAAQGVRLYNSVRNRVGYGAAAKLGEAVVDKLPASQYVSHIGWQSIANWQSCAEYAKAYGVGAKLLKKGLPQDRDLLLQVHVSMATNSRNLGQRTNSVESLKQARAIEDTAALHAQQIQDMYYGAVKAAEMEPVVAQYFQTYPQREDRFYLQSFLALAWFRDKEKARGLQVIREMLPHDAKSNSVASVFVRENGAEPEKLAESEKVLQDAIQKNEEHAANLHWALGFDLYRDRLKDLDKAKATIRDLVTKSPTNDSTTSQALDWLLYNAADDAQFTADVDRHLAVRKERIHWASHRNFLSSWIQRAIRNKDVKDRAQAAKQKLNAADNDAQIKLWLATTAGNRNEQEAAREQLLAPAQISKLTKEQSYQLFRELGDSYYRYGNSQKRAQAATVYGRMVEHFPKDYTAAMWYLSMASSYSPPEVHKQAALHMLTLEPEENASNYDIYYRLMTGAQRNTDAELSGRALAWILRAQDKFGFVSTYSDSIGDILLQLEKPGEAKDYWRRAVAADENPNYARNCAERVARDMEPAERTKFFTELLNRDGDYHGAYAMLLAGDALAAADLPRFKKLLEDSHALQRQRPTRTWGIDENVLRTWINQYRADMEATQENKRLVFQTIENLEMPRASAAAMLARLELPPQQEYKPFERLLEYQRATTMVYDSSTDWDWLVGFAQAEMAEKDYVAVATLVSGMLSNIPNTEAGRLKAGRDMVAQSYARLGSVGLAIDDSSPIAPLLQSALYLRLGDRRLAFENYNDHRRLFDQHRDELPVDLILFVCESHIAAGGDENHDRAEDILRNWLVKFSEATDVDDSTKAAVQLLLAKNYYKAQRYDIARSEYTTVKNRYADTPQAIEAEFGIGECYMAQKVYDQAEAVFEALAASRERDVVIRAEFLRGVLANRRGDRDEARDIFRRVLEMVPSVELANEALFNLSEVYGAEERYMDQLELLRTVGRLGRRSKRWHKPGLALSVVVYDPDLGVSRGQSRIPVRVTTTPGGDEEFVYLYTTPGGKGLFRADLETELGSSTKADKVLQLTGKDTIQCDYPEQFKQEFRSVPLSDAEIRVAASAELEVASSKIIDEEEESFTERIEREAREAEEADERLSQDRPTNQIKPGNQIYVRIKDADRDVSDEADQITVKLEATSGDSVRVLLDETGSHTGVYEGVVTTGELPAGALASDTAIDHNPLMAIDQNPESTWLSQPDGATPKWLSVDMKDLRFADRVTISSPDATTHTPVRGKLEGSHDGRFWFRIASMPPQTSVEPVTTEYGRMTLRLYQGNYTNYTTWEQVASLAKNGQPAVDEEVDQLNWTATPETDEAAASHAAIWFGKFVQPRDGAVRFAVRGLTTALAIDGQLELPVERTNSQRTVDVWLDRGTHDLAIFAATTNSVQGVTALRAHEDHNASQVVLTPFRTDDFNLEQPLAKPALPRAPAEVTSDNGVWDFRFDSYELRHVRLVIDEYLGEAVAINHVQISGEDGAEQHIPPKADVLSLAHNNVLEIAAGDVITASYMDEFTQATGDRSQLLTAQLTATYFNAGIASINYDFRRERNGAVTTITKQLVRIDPGEKFIIEIVDYDHDTTAEPDTLRFQVAVNDADPIELVAHETEPYSGVFTKEVETSAAAEGEKLVVQSGDRIYCSYLDHQNTFPGHAVPRETLVYVNEPSLGRVRVVESRMIAPPAGSNSPPRVLYLPQHESEVAKVAFEVPLTVEVYDRDAAKDSLSTVTVELTTSDGAKVEVECEVSPSFTDTRGIDGERWALEEGRFIGQVILQLGSKSSPDLVPLTSEMPRNMIGGPVVSEDEAGTTGSSLVTRVLNLSGKDVVTANYKDAWRPDGVEKDLQSRGRLIANGLLACTDRDYDEPVNQLHVGEKIYLRVIDPDLDSTDERDVAKVIVTSERGEKEIVELMETLAHSGVFTGSVMLKPSESPTAENIQMEMPIIETFFGDLLRLEYTDVAASTETGELKMHVDVPVVIGTDGLVAAFSKTFSNEKLAVETQFHIAESYFELFKSHKKLGRSEEEKADLESGRRVLEEVMEDFPDPKYVPRIAYLLGQFAQELEQWDEAIDSYRTIVRQFPDHSLAADAQFKLAQCYEKSGDFDQALESYVTLAATYPKSPLIANVMIRINEHFYTDKNYEVAAQVGDKFLEKFEGHEWAPRMAFRVGQCYYKYEKYGDASSAFDRFTERFPEDELCPDAYFWAGESLRLARNNPEAFRRYNFCRWKFPASDAAKYARGRLALPEMLQQFEAEVRQLDNDN